MEKFDQWCIVELMGHQKIAGRCTEQNIAGSNMLRVDVPATNKEPAFTRFYSSSAVYCIHPIDERTTEQMAEKFEQRPIAIWDLQAIIKEKMRIPELRPGMDDSEFEEIGF